MVKDIIFSINFELIDKSEEAINGINEKENDKSNKL